MDSFVLRYIKNSYQDDPIRVVVEIFLIIFAFKYILSKKYKPDSNDVKLTSKEIDELVQDWKPEPLVPPVSKELAEELNSLPVVHGRNGHHVSLNSLSPSNSCLNLSNFDVLALSSKTDIHEKAIKALRKYGVGACGPPGFYGTIDVHIQLENAIAKFLKTEEAIIYSQQFATISSVIPAFAKRGDILVCDEAVNFAIQKGIQISRSNIVWFKHNDMVDLERVLKDIHEKQLKTRKPLTRRFIVIEGLYQNTGNIAPLPELVKLKEKYKFRLIADESLSFGVLGSRGAGITDNFSMPVSSIDILSGSMAHSLGSSGGFCAGSKEVVDHQRLSGVGYCYSAALPAMLAVAAYEGIKHLESSPNILKQIRDNVSILRSTFQQNYSTLSKNTSSKPLLIINGMSFSGARLIGDPSSPFFHFQLIVSETKIPSEIDKKYSPLLELSNHSSIYETFETESMLLQKISDELLSRFKVLVSRAKYVVNQETLHVNAINSGLNEVDSNGQLKNRKAGMGYLKPSLRICVSVGHAKDEMEHVGKSLALATASVIFGK